MFLTLAIFEVKMSTSWIPRSFPVQVCPLVLLLPVWPFLVMASSGDACRAMLKDLVDEISQEKGRPATPKELAKMSGLPASDCKLVLEEFAKESAASSTEQPCKKAKTAAKTKRQRNTQFHRPLLPKLLLWRKTWRS